MKPIRKHLVSFFYLIFILVTSLLGVIIYKVSTLPYLVDDYMYVLLSLLFILSMVFLFTEIFYLKLLKKFFVLLLLPLVISSFFIFWEDVSIRPDTSKELTIEAHYMQYACGDWVDDMNVSKVNDPNYKWLIGRDVDPVFYRGEKVINEMFYSNDTSYSVYKSNIRLKGYLSKEFYSGCKKTSPRFWITHLEKLDGSLFSPEGNNFD